MDTSDAFAEVLRVVEARGVTVDWGSTGPKFRRMVSINGDVIRGMAMKGCTHSDILIAFSGITDKWRAMSFALYLCYQFEEGVIGGDGLELGAARLAETMVSSGLSFSGY